MAEGAHQAAEHAASVFAQEHGTWLHPLGVLVGLCKPTPPGGHHKGDCWLLVAFLIIAGLSALVIVAMRRVNDRERSLVPRGLQNLLEMVVEVFQNYCRAIIGDRGPRYAPIVGSFFLLIFFLNVIGLIPGMVSPTANPNVTLALSLSALVIVVYIGIRENGFLGFVNHMAGEPNKMPWFMWWLPLLMLPIESFSLFVAVPLSLSFRLLGNIFGEDMVISKLAQMAVDLMAKIYLPIPVQLPLMAFGLFTSFVQALVFGTLVAIYISLRLPHEHHGEEPGEPHGALHAEAAH